MFINLLCKPQGTRELIVKAGLNTMSTLSRIIYSLEMRKTKSLNGASIPLRTIAKNVAIACVQYVKGDYFCVKLPTTEDPEKQQHILLQYCHFAHIFCIEPLMRASMHALITAIFRCPAIWSNHDKNTELVEEIGLFPDNPARKLLLHTYKSVIPLLKEYDWSRGLPHDSNVVSKICFMDEKACGKLWSGDDAKMKIKYAPEPQALPQFKAKRGRTRAKAMHNGGFGRYDASDPAY